MRQRTHYAVLGIAVDASDNEVKAAWRAGVKASHPDHHQDDPTATGRFKEIQAAYEVLSDPEKRRNYDLDQRPAPDPDLGWVWEPPPPRRSAPRSRPPPPRPPPRPPPPPKPGPVPATWANRGWKKPEPASAPPTGRCVGCGAAASVGEIRCERCWSIYDDELGSTYEYVVGVMRLREVELAVRRSRRVCYARDQAHLEESFGGLGYWNRDGVFSWVK